MDDTINEDVNAEEQERDEERREQQERLKQLEDARDLAGKALLLSSAFFGLLYVQNFPIKSDQTHL